MTTDLKFWETSVPVVGSLYKVFVAIGWGLLIGNCAFQAMKAMFAGFGFETESPAVLLLRTALFGTLLVFSRDICDIGLSIGKNVIDLLGIPGKVTLTFPDETLFGAINASWLLVIIIGFILGFQVIRLFFEIAERYVIVAILTLLCPVGLSMGGSKSTKDICTGFIRTYASMIVMMVLNVLFLKLLLSALGAMPSDLLVLPWCLLVVGIAKTARKADNLVSRIGMSPAITGDPLGHGHGMMTMMMAARTIMGASRSGKGKDAGRKAQGGSKVPPGGTGGVSHHAVGGTNIAGANASSSDAGVNVNTQNGQSHQNNQSSHFGASNSQVSSQSVASSRFGASSYGGEKSGGAVSSSVHFGGTSGSTKVNTNRFGGQNGAAVPHTGSVKPASSPGNAGKLQRGLDRQGAVRKNAQGVGVQQKKGQFGSTPTVKPGPAAPKGFRQNENSFGKAPETGHLHVTPPTPKTLAAVPDRLRSNPKNSSGAPSSDTDGDDHGK